MHFLHQDSGATAVEAHHGDLAAEGFETSGSITGMAHVIGGSCVLIGADRRVSYKFITL